MPAETSGTTAEVVVISDSVRGLPSSVDVAAIAPGMFSASSSGFGQGAVLNQDNSPNSAANPARAGSLIQIFATGLGPTDPPIATAQSGASKPPFHRTIAMPVVLIGGVPADVLFAGLAPGSVGLYQINARVPILAPAGSAVSLEIRVGDQNSNTVTIAVQ